MKFMIQQTYYSTFLVEAVNQVEAREKYEKDQARLELYKVHKGGYSLEGVICPKCGEEKLTYGPGSCKVCDEWIDFDQERDII
jgi:hypothetical protein